MGKNRRYGGLQLVFFPRSRETSSLNTSKNADDLDNKNNYDGEEDMSNNWYRDVKKEDPNKTAILFNGFFWDCDHCGTENFERAIVPEVDKDVLEAVKVLHNIDDDMSHIMFFNPDTVICKFCERQYKAQVNSI